MKSKQDFLKENEFLKKKPDFLSYIYDQYMLLLKQSKHLTTLDKNDAIEYFINTYYPARLSHYKKLYEWYYNDKVVNSNYVCYKYVIQKIVCGRIAIRCDFMEMKVDLNEYNIVCQDFINDFFVNYIDTYKDRCIAIDRSQDSNCFTDYNPHYFYEKHVKNIRNIKEQHIYSKERVEEEKDDLTKPNIVQ